MIEYTPINIGNTPKTTLSDPLTMSLHSGSESLLGILSHTAFFKFVKDNSE
jgi:hypothetical protein